MTWLAKAVFVGVIGASAISAFSYWQFQGPILREGQNVLVDIPVRGGVRNVALDLSQQNVAYAWQTRIAGWWYVNHHHLTLKAGRYLLNGPMTWEQLFLKISRGQGETMSITFIEGKRWRDFRELLKKNEHISDPEFLNQSEAHIANTLRRGKADWVCPPNILEGCLMPDTYALYSGISVHEVLSRAYVRYDSIVRSIWRTRDADVPLRSPYEMVILASMVEKESAHDEDRGRIARVFMNRLRQGMRLQSDPTVIYGIQNFNGNLTREHLRADHPFNTYTRSGLPYTPIAASGRAALEAVAHPTSGRWYYFVAHADHSTTIFSETLAQHNRAVWQHQVAPAQADRRARREISEGQR
ncbi:MAG: endolytic transglycosylase MltG [Pseudomonadota bacterium]